MAATDVLVIFKGQDSTLSKTASSIGGSFGKLGDTMKAGLAVGVTALGGIGAATLGAGAKLIGLGSASEEMMGKFNVVFANTGGQVVSELDAFGAAVGRSKFDLRAMASTFGDTLKPMGFTEDAAAGMSVGLTKLATDLGSFNDMEMTESLDRLQGVLIGNHENALEFGVIINENTLNAELAAMGADGLTGSMLEQAKVQARMNLLYAGTGDAMGDAERTSTSWANQMRGLKARLTDAATEMGSKLLPAMTPLLGMVGDLAGQAIPLLMGVFDKLAPILETVSTIIQGFVANLQEGMSPLDAFIEAIRDFVPQSVLDALTNFRDVILPGLIEKIEEIKTKVTEFVEPIAAWIEQNMQLSDVLTALGIVLAGVVLSAIASVAIAIAPILLAAGALIGLVALLRTAWENNWGGIQEKTAALIEFITPIFDQLKLWLETNIPIALQTLSIFWTETLLPAIMTVWEWISGTLVPFFTGTVLPLLQENIPAALQTLSDFWTNTLLPAMTAVWDFITVSMMPIWISLKDLFNVGLKLALEALAGIWKNTLLPALTNIWQFVKDKIIPKFQELKSSVIDPLKGSFGGLGDVIQEVADFIQTMADRLSAVELPSWMTPGSPTPWEIGLVGVRNQLSSLSVSELPQFNNALDQVGNSQTNNNRTINQNFTVNTSQFDIASESRSGIQFAQGGI